MTYSKKFWKNYDKQPETMADASKQAWECESYQEWLASMPEEGEREAEAAISVCEANGGHDLVDDSIAGPDSGNMSVYCTKCPYAHTTWLY